MPTSGNEDERTALEAAGSDALDRFIETFNSRDADAWAASLSYPHVRVSPFSRTSTSSPTARHYADAVTYETADAMGWHHSAWDDKHVLAVSPNKIHASAQWCRYNAAGERILPNNVSYVITKIDGRWGIQARFGVDSQPPEQPEAVAEQASSAWSAWWEALRSGSDDELVGRTQFPFFLVDTGEVREVTTAGDLRRDLAEVSRSRAPSAAMPLQVGERGVNLGVALAGPDGRTHHGLFLVTIHDTAVRVAAASLLDGA